jgi:hypothetical protein
MSKDEEVTLGTRVPGFWWEHAEYIAGIETLCPTFAQQEHPVHVTISPFWPCFWPSSFPFFTASSCKTQSSLCKKTTKTFYNDNSLIQQ